MHLIVVMPCLNEEKMLAATCSSLGFGDTTVDRPPGSILVLVDNGSEDRTWDAMRAIQDRSPDRSVILEREAERGYVPPRHRGVMVGHQWAANYGVSQSDVLVVQADADTIYAPEYLAAMEDAASANQNVLIEGHGAWDAAFEGAHGPYIELCRVVDEADSDHFVDEVDDLIVSDALSGYRLDDYFRWGGHRREFDASGDELFAETTRLFMAARLATGARRVRAAAVGYPSRRKVYVNPALYFATCGFPREVSWTRDWIARYTRPNTLAEFKLENATNLTVPMSYRRAHSITLFSTLPSLFAQAAGTPLARTGMSLDLPEIGPSIVCTPGAVLEAALSTLESTRERIL